MAALLHSGHGDTLKGLEAMSLEAFLGRLNRLDALALSENDITNYVRVLERNWFEKAADLSKLDRDACALLDLPPKLTGALMRAFRKNDRIYSVNLEYMPPTLEDGGAPAAALVSSRPQRSRVENGGPRQVGELDNAPAADPVVSKMDRNKSMPRDRTLVAVIDQIIENSSHNEFIMQGVRQLLKKSIDDSDSTAKSRALRDALRRVTSGLAASSGALSGIGGEDAMNEDENDGRRPPVSAAAAAAAAAPAPAVAAAPVVPAPVPAGPAGAAGAGGGAAAAGASAARPAPAASPVPAASPARSPSAGAVAGSSSNNNVIVLSGCGHSFDRAQLHQYVMNLVGQKKAASMVCPQPDCNAEMEVSHVQALLTPDEFNQYLEATLMAFIEQDQLSFPCPQATCKALIAYEPERAMEVPDPITEKDDDGKVLTPETWIHFQQYRLRCRMCQTVFCAQCKSVPYHKGYTCQQFSDRQKSRACRFCAARLTPANSAPPDPEAGPNLQDVCSEAECISKRNNCAVRTLECGCPSNGVRGEREEEALPCLKHDMDNVADEFCSICYTEALKDAPCVQLQNPECGHIFHYHCILQKLKSRWPGARVSFEFLNCPLCQRPIEHGVLESAMTPIRELQAQIESMAMDRLMYEGRMSDPQVVNENGRFHNDPTAFAMHSYLFYMCFKCERPYFAGGYQCQEANAPFNPEELVCPSCQPQSKDDCPKHGKDWLAYKCKYCCSYANWYCWGNTHFCGKCHVSGVWQTLTEFRTGKNKKEMWDYPQCECIREQMEPIVRDSRLTSEQKTQMMEQLMSDPKRCPLGIPHPPNGIEYGLGCSMCEDKETEAKNMEAAEKARKEMEEKRRALGQVKAELSKSPDGMRFAYKKDLDENGVLYYLGTRGRTVGWSNPADQGFVNVSSSGIMNDSAPLSHIVGREEVVRCVTRPVRNAWIMVDLLDMSLELTHYTLRHYSSWDTECLRNWVLEASNDGGVSWDCLKVHRGDKGLNKKGGTHTWAVESNGRRYRAFRITQTDLNSNEHWYLACSGWEMYGLLFDSVGGGDEDELKHAGGNAQQEIVRTFEHHYDFDENGIFFYLGTMGGKTPWQNPALTGQVVASASRLAERPASEPASALCGRSLVRCVTVAKPGQWMCVDLKDKKAVVTAYTLRHYDSWDSECLRNWKFEASNDGLAWTTLMTHRNDEGLQGKGSTHTWRIDGADAKGAFSMFRILQTGKNSNNHFYLACSGLELYGRLKQTPPVQIGRGGIEMSYLYDFDCNGVLYYIGTRGLREQWRNPAHSGLVLCSASQMSQNPPSHPPQAIAGRSLVRCVTAALPNMWMAVDLKDYTLQPTHYTLKHYVTWDTEALRNWVLEASPDGVTWKVLREHRNDEKLDKKGATQTWPLPLQQTAFRVFRVRQTGLNSNNHHYLSLSGIELYGRLYDAHESPQLLAQGPQAGRLIPPFKDGTVFEYKHDLDENGILYWIGTAGRTRPYRNPGETGAVKVLSSPLASQSSPVYGAAGRSVVRCVTEPKKNTYFMFDLGEVYVIPTAYTLRHYDSWDTEALRNWRLEGSHDGKKWKTLSTHRKDKSLDAKGATATWMIKGVHKSYNMFRVIQTGKNSNNHYYLALSGFEIYGTIYSYRKK